VNRIRSGTETAASAQVSNRDDDLADLLVRLQVAVSLNDFLSRGDVLATSGLKLPRQSFFTNVIL
jgi:hypothetical protein